MQNQEGKWSSMELMNPFLFLIELWAVLYLDLPNIFPTPVVGSLAN